MSSTKHKNVLRLRVFAGPNGSGKSTIIQSIRNIKVKGKPIDFGIYVNADDIAKELREEGLNFHQFKTRINSDEFINITLASGMVGGDFPEKVFISSFVIGNNRISVTDRSYIGRLAQILAYYLVKKLVSERKKCSFETVFSHPSKLDIIKEADSAGYKVYLYFVATDSVEINIDRVKYRVQYDGGHDVPVDRIKRRYKKSLNQLYAAAQLTYQSFFFDNSSSPGAKLVAHFKVIKNKKKWDKVKSNEIPNWFIKYYLNKVNKE